MDHKDQDTRRTAKPVSTISIPSFRTDPSPVQVSSVFNGSPDPKIGNSLPDVIICSRDKVYFAVHASVITNASTNAFSGLCITDAQRSPNHPTHFDLEEPSDILNIVLLTGYNISCDQFDPSLESLDAALAAMRKYGLVPLPRYIFRGTPLFVTILALADHSPLEAFTIAARNNIEDLAVDISSKTLDIKLYEMPHEYIAKIGGLYLTRLYRLQDLRRLQMSRMFNVNPKLHPELQDCTMQQQTEVRMSYKLTTGRLFWEFPKVYLHEVESELNAVLTDEVACEECKAILTAETENIMRGWAQLPASI